MLLPPNPTNTCFGCGAENPRGMKLAFEQDDEAQQIVGSSASGAEYRAARDIIHGGIIATVLDEAMGKACRFREHTAVTAELTVEYLRPIQVDKMLRVEGFEIDDATAAIYLFKARFGMRTAVRCWRARRAGS